MAVRCLGPMVLVVVMHWAVLLHRIGEFEDTWWGRTAGRGLIEELWEELWEELQPSLWDWRESASWVPLQGRAAAP